MTGGDLEMVDASGSTLIHRAVEGGDSRVVRCLLEYGAHGSARRKEGSPTRGNALDGAIYWALKSKPAQEEEKLRMLSHLVAWGIQPEPWGGGTVEFLEAWRSLWRKAVVTEVRDAASALWRQAMGNSPEVKDWCRGRGGVP